MARFFQPRSCAALALAGPAAALALCCALPAEAATPRCPSGQMYRVTKKVCAPVSQNLQFLSRGKTRAAVRAASPSDRGTARVAIVSEANAPVPAPRPLALSPYGALDLPSLKCADAASRKCTPAKLFNLE